MNRFPALSISVILVLFTSLGHAVPSVMNYQGSLKDSLGDPVADGNYSVTFTIYDASVAGNDVWSEDQLVTTEQGLFSVLLGSVKPLSDSVFDGSPRYLGMAVGADPEMIPRMEFGTVPYAFQASSIQGSSGLSGQTPHTDWVAPYYLGVPDPVSPFYYTFLSIYNADTVTNRVRFTVYDTSGTEIGSCIKSLDPGRLWLWDSAFQTGGCAMPYLPGGYIIINADGPVAPWGFFTVEEISSIPAASASLLFYKL